MSSSLSSRDQSPFQYCRRLRFYRSNDRPQPGGCEKAPRVFHSNCVCTCSRDLPPQPRHRRVGGNGVDVWCTTLGWGYELGWWGWWRWWQKSFQWPWLRHDDNGCGYADDYVDNYDVVAVDDDEDARNDDDYDYNKIYNVGHGDSVVGLVPFVRRVAGSNPTLGAT